MDQRMSTGDQTVRKEQRKKAIGLIFRSHWTKMVVGGGLIGTSIMLSSSRLDILWTKSRRQFRYKCVSDKDFSVHLSCVALILQNVDIEHPVGYMVNDVVQNHHATYGCGTKTLLMVLDMLAAAALTLNHQGLDDVTIVRGLQQAVELAIEHLPLLPLSSFFKREESHNHINSTSDTQASIMPTIVEKRTQRVEPKDWLEVRTDENHSLPVSSSDGAAAFAGEVPCVKLRLNCKQMDTTVWGSGDEEDVGWFFDGGLVPNDEELEETMQDLQRKVACVFEQTYDLGTVINTTPMTIRDKTSKYRNIENVSLHQKDPPVFSSLGDGADDYDFDSCFDIPITQNEPSPYASREALLLRHQVENSTVTSETSAVMSEKSGICSKTNTVMLEQTAVISGKGAARCEESVVSEMSTVMSEKNAVRSVKGAVMSIVDSDEDFDNCFEDVKFSDTDAGCRYTEHARTSNTAILHGILLQNTQNVYLHGNKNKTDATAKDGHHAERHFSDQKIDEDENEFETVSKTCTNSWQCVNQEEQRMDLGDKLDEMLKRKSISVNREICNQSRHFKTIETTVAIMKGTGTAIDTVPVEEYDGKEANTQIKANLEPIMKSNASTTKALVLNSNGHYNDTNSSLLEMSIDGVVLAKEENDCTSTAVNVEAALVTTPDATKLSADAIKEKLKSIIEGKSKISMSVLHQGSRYFRTMKDCVVNTKEGDELSGEQWSNDIVSSLSKTESNQVLPHANRFTVPCKPLSNTVDSTCSSSLDICRKGLHEDAQRSPTKQVPQGFVTEEGLRRFVCALSHGEEVVGKMVFEAVWHQLPENGSQKGHILLDEFRFDPHRVHTVTCPGVGCQRSEVVQGLVVPASPQVLELLEYPTRRRALLINGDVTPNFQHQGINKRPDSLLISGRPASISRQHKWLKNITQTLRKMSVTALLVKGAADPAVVDFCCAHDIVILTRVGTHLLVAIAETTKADIAMYVTECTEDNIALDVTMKPWCPDWPDQVTCLHHTAYALITTSTDIVQTVVVCHPCGDIAAVTEEKWWHVAHRLRLAFSCGQVVEGGSEQLIAIQLHNTAQNLLAESSKPTFDVGMCGLLPVVIEAVADGFRSLGHTLELNSTGQSTESSFVGPAIMASAATSSTSVGPQQDTCSHYRFGAQGVDSHPTTSSDRTCHRCVPDSSQSGHCCAGHQILKVSSDSDYDLSSTCFECGHGGVQMVDEYTSKVEAYRSAVQLVCQILLTDYEVVTGLSNTKSPDGNCVVNML